EAGEARGLEDLQRDGRRRRVVVLRRGRRDRQGVEADVQDRARPRLVAQFPGRRRAPDRHGGVQLGTAQRRALQDGRGGGPGEGLVGLAHGERAGGESDGVVGRDGPTDGDGVSSGRTGGGGGGGQG